MGKKDEQNSKPEISYLSSKAASRAYGELDDFID